MPDEPIHPSSGDSPNPEERLRKMFDDIEREHGQSHSVPDVHTPSNDEIRADALSSPIEGPLGPLHIGVEDHDGDEIDPDEARLLELERELEDVSTRRREEQGAIRSEFDQRMAELDGKIQKMKEARTAKEQNLQRQYATDASTSKGLGLGLTIAYTFIGLPLVGALIGWAIDRALGTDIYKGILMMVGAAGGLALTVMFLKRADDMK